MKGFIRPRAKVLSDKAVIPRRNLIRPHPTHFTHELKRAEPYFFEAPDKGAKSDGKLAAGTPVALMVHDGGRYCRVVDPHGLYVTVRYSSLKKRRT